MKPKTESMVSQISQETSTKQDQPSTALAMVFGSWSFLASLLIFWVELMVAKMLLPRFGGSASVWNTALVFFQVNLLVGYAGAHLLARLDSRRHKAIQAALVVLPLLTLPISLPAFLDSQTTTPTIAVLLALTLMMGAPFFALSTSTPTLQTWFSHSKHPRASDPYFLYALSNVGSVVGLLGYPIILERFLSIRGQTILWSFGYGAFVVLTVAATRLVGSWQPVSHAVQERPLLSRRIKWAATAFVPSLALLGVTRHLSTDVAAFPLMWTIPLVLYLASFTLTFRDGGERWTRGGEYALRILIVPTALVALVARSALWLEVLLPLSVLLAVSLAAHGRVYRDRPRADSLTGFYLWVSIGGAAGGLLASLVAPAVFDFILEYPLALILAALLAGRRLIDQVPRLPLLFAAVAVPMLGGVLSSNSQAKTVLFGLAGVVAVLWMGRESLAVVLAGILIVMSIGVASDVTATERTFFGVYRVHDAGEYRYLMSGTTIHGTQLFEDGVGLLDPVSYYHPNGPVADVLVPSPFARNVGILGLGVGNLVSYGGPEDVYTFYEIDPAVEDLANDPRYFTQLAGALADVVVVIGDGRLELEKAQPSHDVLILDAFTSDAVPVHLMTLEAFQVYLDALSDDGVLMVHITNRHLDLEPVVGRIASELGIEARIRRYSPAPGDEWASPSTWMVLEPGRPLDLGVEWMKARIGDVLWTDDYSNVLSVIEWG